METELNNINNNLKIDKKKKSIFKKIMNFMGLNNNKAIANTIEIENNKTMWVPDEKAPTCYNCHKQFSAIFLRKHHCRICGNVFCKDCSSKTVEGKYWGKLNNKNFIIFIF